MALYEHVFLSRQDLSQQQVDELVERFKGVIEAGGGSVGRIENWGLKSLTYRVNKNRKAYYTLMDLTCPPAALNEMERQMGISEDVLRFMTIKVEKHEDGPSAMMQKREERSERGSFGDRGPRSFGDRDRGDRGGDRPARSFGGDRDGGGDRGPRPQRSNEGSAE
jgi:small subunit ribosomal protein S6